MHIKLLEAMACGLPVVCTSLALGTIRAINGKDIVIADDAIDFSKCCIELLQNYEMAKSIGNAARKLIMKEYSWESHIDMIESIYRTMINKTSTGG